ncbi:NAD-dependent epimerase/dehydratase family protein [Staphylococcus delphini]
MKRYLITGGTGMVGRALVEQLTRSNEAMIYILTRSDKTSQQQHVHYINILRLAVKKFMTIDFFTAIFYSCREK